MDQTSAPRKFLALIGFAPVYQELHRGPRPGMEYHTLGAMLEMMRDQVAPVHSLGVKGLRVVADMKGFVTMLVITTGGEPKRFLLQQLDMLHDLLLLRYLCIYILRQYRRS